MLFKTSMEVEEGYVVDWPGQVCFSSPVNTLFY